jgi:hypothetical protein
MTVENYRSLVVAEQDGQTFMSAWRKQPAQVTTAGVWFDLSMSPGAPVPNYYIGPSNKFTTLTQGSDGGIPHGPGVSPIGAQKFLRQFMALTGTAAATPLPMFLMDYQGFYPFIDESITDEQFMDNSTRVLRVTRGCRIMPVVVAGHIGGGTFFVRYTNDNGVSGRQTPQHVLTSAQLVNGTVITSAGALGNSRGPFMALQAGDSGVSSVDSVVFEVADIGLIALALVAPLASHMILGVDAPVERDLLMDASMAPEIKDDAYLNLVVYPSGSLSAAPIFGYIRTCWI